MKKNLIKTILFLLSFLIVLSGFWILSSNSKLIFFEVIGVGTVVYHLIKYLHRLEIRMFPEDVVIERYRKDVKKIFEQYTN